MARPTFSTQISLGNVIQLVVLLVAVTSAWFTLDNRVSNNTKTLTATIFDHERDNANTILQIKDARLRIRSVENGLTRSDERFTSILQFMSRIEKNVEIIGNKVDRIGRDQ